jgi:hypothetical protein
MCAAGAHAFPTLPEARAFLNPQVGYLGCGPASGGFAASCAASGTAVGGTENPSAVLTGPSTASYSLGRDPSVNVTSDFERVYPTGGGGYVESGGDSAEVLFEVAYCTDPTCTTPSGAVHPIDINYGLSLSHTASPYDPTDSLFYDAGLSFGYYGTANLLQASLCDECTHSGAQLQFGSHSISTTMQDNTVYELAISVDVEGMGPTNFTLDPTFTAPGGTGTFIYSPLVTGGVPEPATWALMTIGCGLAGAGLRRRRSSACAA